MKNGEEYCRLIREQIETLLDKARLGDNEREILHQLNSSRDTLIPLSSGRVFV